MVKQKFKVCMCIRNGLEEAQQVNAFCEYYENLGNVTRMPSALRQ